MSKVVEKRRNLATKESERLINKKIKSEEGIKLPLAGRGRMDRVILVMFIIFLLLGTAMILSSGSEYAYSRFNDPNYFWKKQFQALAVAAVAFIVTVSFDYKKYLEKKFVIAMLLLGSIGSLVLVLLIGSVRNNAKRWINLGPIDFQPSELVKIALIIVFAYIFSRDNYNIEKVITGLGPPIAILGIVAFLLYKQPHYSAIVIIGGVTMMIMFYAGAKKLHFIIAALGAGLAGGAMIIMKPYMIVRIKTFMDPFADRQDTGYQVVQSLYAIATGGFGGRGLGKSIQKFSYLPEAYNDFIFAIMVEELGFAGVLPILALFAAFIWRGMWIAMHAEDKFGMLLAAGMTTLIALQVIINIGVVTGLMPNTGMPLPFFSYGGTSLAFTAAAVGIILNVSMRANHNK